MGFTVLALGFTTAMAQVEDDDLYFNRKDRAKLQKALAATEPAQDFLNSDRRTRFDYPIDALNGEQLNDINTNPEFISRSASVTSSQIEEEDYFVENYQYNTNQNLNNFNNNFNRWNNSTWYNNRFFSPGINTWNSPFYSPINDPFFNNGFGNPWCNPYFGNGLSVSFSYMWGNAWNYGWNNPGFNGGLGWNNWGFNDPWGWNSWNNPWGWNSWNNWNNVIIVDNSRAPIYGKRGTRSYNNGEGMVSTRSRNITGNNTNYGSRSNNNYTNRTSTRTTQEYYTPQWRRTGTDSNGQITPAQRNRTENNWNNNNNNRSYSTPDRSFSSPSRSSGGNSGGGSRTRGRGN